MDRGTQKKALASLLMLVLWAIWDERNARVFRNFSTQTTIPIANIKEEARWYQKTPVSSVGWRARLDVPEGIGHGHFTQVRAPMVKVIPYSSFALIIGGNASCEGVTSMRW